MAIRRTVLAALASAGIAGAALLASGATATAQDNGDGYLACNRGEICFWRYSNQVQWTKQFWHTGNHGSYHWANTSVRMQDDAVEVTNRDTQCWVRVGNLSPHTGTWTWIEIPNDHLRKGLGPIRNANDRHERCY